MKKILSYTLIMAVAILAASCQKKGQEEGVVTMPGVFYADIPGEKEVVEIFPGASKTYTLKACAFQNQVTDIVMNFSFKADPEGVDKFNQTYGTSYVMCPGSAFEFMSNDVMIPRYGQASTTARVKVTASGLDNGVTYILPVTLDKAKQTEDWAVADTLAAYVLFKMSDYDPYGPGTESNPYPIASVSDFKAMKDKLVEGSKVYFKLEADIDMEGVTDWVPFNVETPYKPFDLDGDGHTISNYTGTTSLFGGVSGRIANLNVTGVSIVNAAGPIGVLGSNGGETGQGVEVRNVFVQGKIVNKAANGTGGLFGIIQEAVIDACAADIILETTKYDVGGIYGYDNTIEGKKSVISNCWTTGDYSGNRMVGGIAGMIAYQNSETTISCCYSTARVRAQFKYGGIAGDGAKGTATAGELVLKQRVEKCIAWNEAVHTTSTDANVHYSAGAIVGYTAIRCYLIDCVRRPDLDFLECPANTTNVLNDQENASPESALKEAAVSPGANNYNFPYHGKAAKAGMTASQVAKNLGWDETIWDLSGNLPFFVGGDAPVPDDNAGGQLPDFPEVPFN